jgi:hypothetical protein
MKKFLLSALVLGASTTMFGGPVACSGPVLIMSFNPGGCFAGPGLFTNFSVTPVTPPPGPVILVGSTVVGADVTLNINPSLNNPTGAEEDTLSFTVSGFGGGFVIGASSTNGGGTGTTTRQVVCTGAIDVVTGACTGTLLQDVTLGGSGSTGGPIPFLVPGFYASVNVWRDNLAPGNSVITGGSSDFLFAPEPGVFMLLGSGLCALALLRRKTRA